MDWDATVARWRSSAAIRPMAELSPEQWTRAKELFHAAVERPPAERRAFVHDNCRDTEVAAAVEGLLAGDDAAGGFLETPAAVLVGSPIPADASALTVGQPFGAYTIVARIGAGGMGEVYRAHDTKLGRDVAIKVLPTSLALHPERLARFDREARLLATLNHPNIATIHGIEDAPSASGRHVRAIVMELIDGETLAQRLQRGPIPLPEALAIARHVTDALDAAHGKSIIHRDLKPANIALTPDGVVKVLDFGLAKAASDDAATGDPTQSPTVTVAGTREGVILGTAAYMSPEQARGRAVDKRTDIWAFGCVLYEMLAGRTAFAGETISDTIAAILQTEPDWSAIGGSSPTVGRLLRRCLEKDPKRRLRDIGDVGRELEDALQEPPSSVGARPFPALWLWVAIGIAVLAVAASAIWVDGNRMAPPTGVVRLTVTLDAGGNLIASPDGQFLAAFIRDSTGNRRLWLRSLSDTAGSVIPGTEDGDRPFWSSDSRWVFFLVEIREGTRLKKVSRDGGSPQTVHDLKPRVEAGVTVNAAGDMVLGFSNRGGLSLISASGGPAKTLTTLDDKLKENSHRAPRFLPDGRHFIFTARSGASANNAVYVGSIDTGETRRLTHVESPVMYLAPREGKAGALLFVREGTLFRQAFDGQTVSGDLAVVAENVRHNTVAATAAFSASLNGRLLVVGHPGDPGGFTAWFKPNGNIDGVVFPGGGYEGPRLAPDGNHLLFNRPDRDEGNRDVWSLDVHSQKALQLTTNPANDLQAAWSPHGDQIAFASDRTGANMRFYLKSATDVGAPERLIAGIPPGQLYLSDWSRDGQWLALINGESTAGKIWMVSMAHSSESFVWLESTTHLSSPRFSPHGGWIAYASVEAGRSSIFLRRFSGKADADSRALQLSTDEDSPPVWSTDGSEIFFLSDSQMYSVDTRPRSLDKAMPEGHANVRRLFTACPDGRPTGDFDVAPDKRFFIRCGSAQVSFKVSVYEAGL